MKQSILLTLFMVSTFFVHAQKVKLSKESKEKYVSQEILDKEKEKEQVTVVYAILRTKSEAGSDFLQISLDESSMEIPTKAASMKFPELVKLTRTKFSAKSEIDLINYLADREWEVVAIENESEKKMIRRKYYLRKAFIL